MAAETPQAPALAAAQAELAARLLCDPALASSRQVITLEDGIG